MLVALTGCVSQESTVQSRFAILHEDAKARDQLPVEPYGGAYDALDTESARYAGQARGVRLWIAVAEETGNACVVAVPEETERSVVGCSGNVMAGRGEELLKLRLEPSPEVLLLTDGEPQVDPVAWEKVSANIWVKWS